MCSSGSRYDSGTAARLARIAAVKSAQKARKSTHNVVLGSDVVDYRRNFGQGAKNIGTTADMLGLRELSAAFAGNAGQGATNTAFAKAERERKRKGLKNQRGGEGGGGDAGGDGGGVGGIGI